MKLTIMFTTQPAVKSDTTCV